jgi:hypothetical protein
MTLNVLRLIFMVFFTANYTHGSVAIFFKSEK